MYRWRVFINTAFYGSVMADDEQQAIQKAGKKYKVHLNDGLRVERSEHVRS